MPVHDLAEDLALLTTAARAAGLVAREYFGTQLDVQHKPADMTPVTQADLAVNALLEDRLRTARPDYGWLSEESAEDPARSTAPRTFVVDPIDGTRAFIAGEKPWAHSLAVVEAGEVVAGVVFLPMLDRLYAATRGGGATADGAPIRVGQTSLPEEAEVLTSKPNLAAHYWKGGTAPFVRAHRPSLAYRLCLVAEGRYDAMLTFQPAWEWDIAAGALILAEAGAEVSDRHGVPLRFNGLPPQTEGMITANPALHAALRARMA